MFNKICKQNIQCPLISGATDLKAVSDTSSGSRVPCSHGLAYRCSVFFTSAQSSHVPSSAFSTQTEELMQLDCSWASSGTTSSDIVSICDVQRQQCSHFRETAHRHLSLLVGREAACPHWKGRQGYKSVTFLSSRAVHWLPLECDSWGGDGLLYVHRIWRELCSWSTSPFWQQGVSGLRVKT